MYGLPMSEALRTARIHIAATPDDKKLYRRAARTAGQSLSDWMRTRLRVAAESERAAPPPFETAGRPVEPRTVPGEGEPR